MKSTDAVTISTVQYYPKEKREAIEKYLEQVLNTKPVFMWVSSIGKAL